MNKIKKIGTDIIYVVAGIIIICSIFSLFRNSTFQYFKMLDFPRIQLFTASLFCTLLLLKFQKKWIRLKIFAIAGLFLSLTIHGVFLKDYTTLVKVSVPDAQQMNIYNNRIRLLLANVEMSNRDADPLKRLIEEKEPDLILAMEIDDWWNDQLKFLEQKYPYFHRTINNKTYGMVFYSKFPLENLDVNYLNNANVPSLKCIITLQSGKKINFHGLHPVPPTSFKNLPDNFGKKEKSLLLAGRKIKNENLPVIFAGDLNDVVWSRVDQLTGTKNKLFDVRTGRGFYNTFSDKSLIMKWPLDHVFVSKEFKLIQLKKLSSIGSDHLPFYVELTL